MNGLSDKAQAVLTFVSAALIAVAGVGVPSGLDPRIALGLGVVGAIGFAIKEVLGTR